MGERIHLHTVSSTSVYLSQQKDNYGDFSFVYADIQTAGHGRNGRVWHSPLGENLTFSFLIKDPKILALGPRCTLLTAYCVASFIESLGIEGVSIKWPNDIYIGDKKAVGILLEGSLPEYMVIGVGLNINQTKFEGEYRIPPTSLTIEAGHAFVLDDIRERLFDDIERIFHAIPTSFEHALGFFRSHDYLYGKTVRVEGKGPYIASGVDEGFRLKLVSGDETLWNISGEIRIIEP